MSVNNRFFHNNISKNSNISKKILYAKNSGILSLCMNQGKLVINNPILRNFSTSAPDKSTEESKRRGFAPSKDSFKEYQDKKILDVETAQKYCRDIVKKHDFYTYIVGGHFPKSKQKYFYTIHAFLLEVLKSREASKQVNICKMRLLWWAETLHDIEEGKKISEPVGVAVQDMLKNTKINFDLIHRIVSYQLFDLERSEMATMNELSVYAENTRSLTFYLYLHVLGVDDENAYTAAGHLGRCYGIIDILRKMQYYLINHR